MGRVCAVGGWVVVRILGVRAPWSVMIAPDISASRSVCSAKGLEPSERVRPGMYGVKQDPKCSLASLNNPWPPNTHTARVYPMSCHARYCYSCTARTPTHTHAPRRHAPYTCTAHNTHLAHSLGR